MSKGTGMLYLKEIKDIMLLEVELKKMKALYAHILRQSEDQSFLKDLRRRIKYISAQINVMQQQTFYANNSSMRSTV